MGWPKRRLSFPDPVSSHSRIVLLRPNHCPPLFCASPQKTIADIVPIIGDLYECCKIVHSGNGQAVYSPWFLVMLALVSGALIPLRTTRYSSFDIAFLDALVHLLCHSSAECMVCEDVGGRD